MKNQSSPDQTVKTAIQICIYVPQQCHGTTEMVPNGPEREKKPRSDPRSWCGTTTGALNMHQDSTTKEEAGSVYQYQP